MFFLKKTFSSCSLHFDVKIKCLLLHLFFCSDKKLGSCQYGQICLTVCFDDPYQLEKIRVFTAKYEKVQNLLLKLNLNS